MKSSPIAPHLLFPQFLNDDIPEERNRAIQMNMEILKKCDQLWVFGKIFSEGMKEEINFASQYMIPIQYIVFHDESPQIFNHFADQIDDAGWAFQQSEKINLAHSRKISIAQEVANDFSCRFDEVENVFCILLKFCHNGISPLYSWNHSSYLFFYFDFYRFLKIKNTILNILFFQLNDFYLFFYFVDIIFRLINL